MQSDSSIVMPSNLVEDAFTAMLAAQVDSWDNEALHASDMGKCARELWARRNGHAMIGVNNDTERKFQLGRDVEEYVAKALIGAGYHVLRNLSVPGFVGHPDIVITDALGKKYLEVIEVKSTTFYPVMVNGKRTRVPEPRDRVKTEHKLQACTYAWRLGLPTFRLVIVCRESGMMAEHVFKTSDYVGQLEAEIDRLSTLTAVGVPDPGTLFDMDSDDIYNLIPKYSFNVKTGASWKCSWCSYGACERNSNPEALVIK